MNSRFSLVVFLFLMVVPMDVLCTDEKECGENVEFTSACNDPQTCNPDDTIKTVVLKISNETHNNKLLMKINVTDKERNCSHNGKFCVKVSKDRKRINLTVHDATFRDKGTYTVYIEQVEGKIQKPTFNIFVKDNTDNLECKVDVESDNNPTISIDTHRKCDKNKTVLENVTAKDTTLRNCSTLKDETRNVEMCYTVSCKTEGKLEDSQIQPSNVVNDADTDNKIMIIILCACLLGLAFGIGVVFGRRGSLTRGNRERTFSEVGLIEDQAENMDGAAVQPLQRPQDQV